MPPAIRRELASDSKEEGGGGLEEVWEWMETWGAGVATAPRPFLPP